MSLADYLAKNYLTADSKPNKKAKKRKRKDDPQAGLVIADDDALGWNPAGDGLADEDAPMTGKFFPPIHDHQNPSSFEFGSQSAVAVRSSVKPKPTTGKRSGHRRPRPPTKLPPTQS